MAIYSQDIDFSTPPSQLTPINIGFNPTAVYIYNFTAYWIYLPDAEVYIPPFYINACRLLHHATQNAYVVLKSPYEDTQLPTEPSFRLRLTWTNDPSAVYVGGNDLTIGTPAATGGATAAKQDAAQTTLDQIVLNQGNQATSADITALGAKIDSLSTKIDTTNTKLDAVKTSVDTTATNVTTLGTKVDSSNTKLDNLKTSTDAVKTSVDTTAGNVTTLGTKVDSSNTKLDSIGVWVKPINNALIVGTVSVGSTQTLLRTTSAQESIALYNASTTTNVYLGPTGVTSSTGFPLLPGQGVSFDLDTGQSIYGITATGTASVNLLRGVTS